MPMKGRCFVACRALVATWSGRQLRHCAGAYCFPGLVLLDEPEVPDTPELPASPEEPEDSGVDEVPAGPIDEPEVAPLPLE